MSDVIKEKTRVLIRNYGTIAIVIIVLIIGFAQYILPAAVSRTISVASAATPVLAGQYNIAGSTNSTDIAVEGNYAYVVTGNTRDTSPEFLIMNVASTTQPQLIGSINYGIQINKVRVAGDYAYLATNNNAREFDIVKVSNKSAPNVVGGFDIPGSANGISLFVTATSSPNAFGTILNYSTGTSTAYVGTRANSSGRELYIFDTSNRGQVTVRGSYEVGGDVNDIYVVNGRAYLATSLPAKELLVLNVSNPRAITEEASYDLPNTTGARAVYHTNGRIYVGGYNNNSTPDFFIFDVTGAAPQFLSSTNLSATSNDIKVFAGKAYVATQISAQALTIVDVSNPVAPVIQSVFSASARASAVALGSSFIYLITENGSRELQIVDPLLNIVSFLTDANNDGKITVVCMGDSNTDMAWWVGPSWCEQLRDLIGVGAPVRMENYGHGGGTATDLGLVYYVPSYAGVYLQQAFENVFPDAVVFAYGTNDIGFGATIPQIISAYSAHVASTTAYGARAYVALTPFRRENATSTFNMQYDALNSQILSELGTTTSGIIDFNSMIINPTDYQDFVHMNIGGHAKRARAVYQQLIGQY